MTQNHPFLVANQLAEHLCSLANPLSDYLISESNTII
jgi:hypothetical protein